MPKKLKNAINFQEKLNGILEKNLPVNLSLAKEISEILEISLDSAYRRLRNQTEYTLNEVALICHHFDIPLESLNNELQSVVTFKINHFDNQIESYQKYLENMLLNLEKISLFNDVQIFFAAEDIPVFYHFSQNNLLQFKIIYWLKSLLNIQDFQYKNYEEIELPETIKIIAKKIYEKFESIASTEIWTSETVLSTLKQIRFYFDAGFFTNSTAAFLILDDLELVLKNIHKSTDIGFKFSKGNMTNVKLKFYLSDVMIGNNSILVKAEGFSTSFISYNTFNFMQTTNVNFNLQNEQWLNNILSKSTLLSTVAEKQRNQFFKSVNKQISELRNYITLND